MNLFKKKQRPPKKAKTRSRFTKSLIGLLNGNILTKEEVVAHLPYFLFLSLLALIYIANGYWAEGTVRSLNRVDNELKELRSEYITTKSDLMYNSKQSQVAQTLKEKGMTLKESLVPPKKIIKH